eukprot:Lankesteria_metandrocarpae@DN5378_c1_g1_i1.p1
MCFLYKGIRSPFLYYTFLVWDIPPVDGTADCQMAHSEADIGSYYNCAWSTQLVSSMDETSPASHMSAPLVVVAEADNLVGTHIVYQLLHKGYRVKAVGRKLTAGSQRATEMQKIHCRAEECLTFGHVDIKQHSAEAWVKSLSGASHAIVVAVPQTGDIDSRRIAGILNFLEAAKETKSVKVAVVTSSLNAVIEGHPKSRYGVDAEPFDEESLGDASLASRPADKYFIQLERSIESKSFKLASVPDVGEAALTDDPSPTNDAKFMVVSLCVGHVAGPELIPTATVPANSFLTKVMKKRVDSFPSRSLQLIDVRDVADAHVRALEFIHPVDAYTYRRCLVSTENGNDTPESHAKMLAELFRPYGFNASAKIQSWGFGLWGAPPKDHLPRNIVINSGKTNSDLVLTPRPLSRVFVDLVMSLVKRGTLLTNRIPSNIIQSFLPYGPVVEMPEISSTCSDGPALVKDSASDSDVEATEKTLIQVFSSRFSGLVNTSTMAANNAGVPAVSEPPANATPAISGVAVAAGAAAGATAVVLAGKQDQKLEESATKKPEEEQKAVKEAAKNTGKNTDGAAATAAVLKTEDAKRAAEEKAAEKTEEEKLKAAEEAANKAAEVDKMKTGEEAAAKKAAEEAANKAAEVDKMKT